MTISILNLFFAATQPTRSKRISSKARENIMNEPDSDICSSPEPANKKSKMDRKPKPKTSSKLGKKKPFVRQNSFDETEESCDEDPVSPKKCGRPSRGAKAKTTTSTKVRGSEKDLDDSGILEEYLSDSDALAEVNSKTRSRTKSDRSKNAKTTMDTTEIPSEIESSEQVTSIKEPKTVSRPSKKKSILQKYFAETTESSGSKAKTTTSKKVRKSESSFDDSRILEEGLSDSDAHIENNFNTRCSKKTDRSKNAEITIDSTEIQTEVESSEQDTNIKEKYENSEVNNVSSVEFAIPLDVESKLKKTSPRTQENIMQEPVKAEPKTKSRSNKKKSILQKYFAETTEPSGSKNKTTTPKKVSFDDSGILEECLSDSDAHIENNLKTKSSTKTDQSKNAETPMDTTEIQSEVELSEQVTNTKEPKTMSKPSKKKSILQKYFEEGITESSGSKTKTSASTRVRKPVSRFGDFGILEECFSDSDAPIGNNLMTRSSTKTDKYKNAKTTLDTTDIQSEIELSEQVTNTEEPKTTSKSSKKKSILQKYFDETTESSGSKTKTTTPTKVGGSETDLDDSGILEECLSDSDAHIENNLKTKSSTKTDQSKNAETPMDTTEIQSEVELSEQVTNTKEPKTMSKPSKKKSILQKYFEEGITESSGSKTKTSASTRVRKPASRFGDSGILEECFFDSGAPIGNDLKTRSSTKTDRSKNAETTIYTTEIQSEIESCEQVTNTKEPITMSRPSKKKPILQKKFDESTESSDSQTKTSASKRVRKPVSRFGNFGSLEECLSDSDAHMENNLRTRFTTKTFRSKIDDVVKLSKNSCDKSGMTKDAEEMDPNNNEATFALKPFFTSPNTKSIKISDLNNTPVEANSQDVNNLAKPDMQQNNEKLNVVELVKQTVSEYLANFKLELFSELDQIDV